MSDATHLTLGQELKAAHKAIDTATERRNRLILHAQSKGATLRQIAEAIGVAPSTVMRWLGQGGHGTARGNPLDGPTFRVEDL